MVLLRHLSPRSQPRRDPAIPLCRRRDRRRGVSLESDLAGAGGRRRLGGVRRRSRQMVARPVRAGAVRRLLCLDPRAVSRVGCPAVFRRAAATGATGIGRRRPAVAEIATEPAFIAAAVAAMVAYGVMSLVMTATPIAMLDCGHEFAAAAFVIQWHSLGMFAPSFVTGHLITRLGLTRIMLTGAVLLLLCSLINLCRARYPQFLGRQRRAGGRLEFSVCRRHDAADPHLRRRGKGQGSGIQRFSRVRHRDTVIVRFGRDAVGRWLDYGADRRRAVRRGRRGGGAVVAPPRRERHCDATPC